MDSAFIFHILIAFGALQALFLSIVLVIRLFGLLFCYLSYRTHFQSFLPYSYQTCSSYKALWMLTLKLQAGLHKSLRGAVN